jgi:hypothetical protein
MKKLFILVLVLISVGIANAKQLGVSYSALSGPGILTWGFTGDHKSLSLQLGADYQSEGKIWNMEPGLAFRLYHHAVPIEFYWGLCLSAPMHKHYVGKEFRSGVIIGFAHDFRWNDADFSWEVETNPLTFTARTSPSASKFGFSTNPSVSIGLNYFYK